MMTMFRRTTDRLRFRRRRRMQIALSPYKATAPIKTERERQLAKT